MKNSATLIAVALSLVACGGGGGGSSPAPAPVPVPPALAPPVVTPPVVVPPVVAPPVVVPPVVVPPVVAACAAPTVAQSVVLWAQTPMNAICAGVYIEPGVPADDELYQRQSVAFATAQITAYYGSMTAMQPDIILCKTAACRAFFVGTTFAAAQAGAGTRLPGATYITARTTIFVTYTSFLAFGRNTMTHELAHAELQARIVGGSGIPAWFNEGQATLIGKDPDCTNVSTVNVIADLTTLDIGAAWQAVANVPNLDGTPTRIYCQAQREVSAWVTKNGQPKYLALLASVKAGLPFYSVYGKLLTQ